MSDDLISRKALMSHIENQYRQRGDYYDAERILVDIEDFHTAYDEDKVVERLRCESINCHIMTYRAIEIVKAGGVDEQRNII